MFAAHSGELEAMERCCTTAQLRVASMAGISPAEMRPVVTQLHTDLHEFNMSQPRATQHCEPLLLKSQVFLDQTPDYL